MNYLRGLYDSSSHRLMVEFKNVLLDKHWDLFSDMMGEASRKGYIHEDTEIKHVAEGKSLIMIPCNIEGSENLRDGDRITNLPSMVTEHLSNVLESFSRRAAELEMSELEFIPLSGYPLEQMKEDVDRAIKDKRNIVLIDTYRNYKRLVDHLTEESKQLTLEYLNNEYADLAWIIHSGNLKELNKYKTKLEKKSWI